MRPPHPHPLPRTVSLGGMNVARGGEGAGGRHLANAPGIDRAGLVRWGLFALVAALLWSPVVYGLQSVGGYSVVAKNHAGYLVGIGGWWDGLCLHFAYHGWLTTLVGVGGLVLVGGLLLYQQGRRGIDLVLVMFCMVITAQFLGVGGTLGLSSFLASVWLVRDLCVSSKDEEKSHRLIKAMLLAWWIGLTLTTPLYTPYARLSLPWLISCWLLFGALMSLLTLEYEKLERKSQLGLVMPFFVPLIACVLIPQPPETHSQLTPLSILPAWSDRTGLRKATGQIMHELDMGRRDMRPSEVSGYDAAVYVVGEPALFCHLSKASQTSEMNLIVKPGANMSVAAPGPPLPTFILTGSHASSAEVAEVIAAGRMELIWEQRVLVSDMVALDSASLPQLQVKVLKSQQGPDHTIPIRIYRVRQ